MSKISKINCPECGKEFDAGTAFNVHLDNAKKDQEKKQKRCRAKNIQNQ